MPAGRGTFLLTGARGRQRLWSYTFNIENNIENTFNIENTSNIEETFNIERDVGSN